VVEDLSVIITLVSYITGAMIAFRIFDLRKKGQERDAKDDWLLWPLLLVVGLGGGVLISLILKSLFGLA